MISRKRIAAAVAAAVAAACSDVPVVEPTLSSEVVAPRFDVVGAPETPARLLVVFAKSAPPGFESQVEALGGRVLVNHPIGVAVVEGLDKAATTTLQRRVHAQYVVPDGDFSLVQPAAICTPSLESSLTRGPASAADPTSAILYSLQWNMRQVHADGAWAMERLGSPDVTVAILDTGIDYMLPDLAGLVDLSRSTSFEPADDYYTALYFPGRDPSTDLHYHGTNVATQVASNAWAFAGVTSRTTLMSVKVCSVTGGCHGVYEGILWAIDHGADVINMSLAGWFTRASQPGLVSAYNRLMDYARRKGVTIVVAAGNDGDDLDRQQNILVQDEEGATFRVHLPSFFAMYCDASHVICVAASRLLSLPADYSNYGRSAIDVAAPGGYLGEWIYALCPQTSLVFDCSGGYYVLGLAGTSQAAPHVSGLAALAVEDVGRVPARVKAYIRNSADRLGGGNTPYYGKGQIDVAKAVGGR